MVSRAVQMAEEIEGEPATGVEDDDPEDVANEDAEEDFEAGMRQNAADYQAHDADGDQKLDFGEFCALVRDRETGDFTEEELMARFKQLDADGSGKVDLHEYVRWSLRDALGRSSSRVIDLFKQWDDDGSGEIDKKEFRRAIKSMGFDFFANDSEIDTVFDEFDIDKGGTINYKELNKMLRVQMQLDPKLQAGAVAIQTGTAGKHKLRRRDPTQKTSKLGAVELDESLPVQEQLRELLTKNAVRVIDLFREWDEDGSGTVDKKEFRKALQALGVKADKEELNTLFDTLDTDKGGTLEYGEINKALRRGGTVALDPSLQAGAVSIELKAKNKASSRSPQKGRGSGAISVGRKGGGSGGGSPPPRGGEAPQKKSIQDLVRDLP